MSYVDLDVKDLKRMLSIFSEQFRNKEMSDADEKLKKKLEVMLDAETEWENENTE